MSPIPNPMHERRGRGHDQIGKERGPEQLSSIYVSLSWPVFLPATRPFAERPGSLPGAHFNGVSADLLQE
jgi:hypothetical protein